MPRVVGLDIGTFAVRAAEMNVGSGVPQLLRFGQVALPAGAVRDGEIVDVEAIGAALRRLWREGGFRNRHVVIGVANQRIIVRPAEMPLMSESDLASALAFEAQELIPIPIEEALLDFQVLDQITNEAGEARMRILLAAAQRDMVNTHLAAVERGGLAVDVVDPVPFAMVRALAGREAAIGDGSVEAIVNIGGGVTNVVVHQDGSPRFVRVLLIGGDDLTEAIARELATDLDTAEDLKRQVGAAVSGGDGAVAARIVSDRLGRIVEEIRGSLDYYQAQADALPLRRVLVTGGASRTAGLLERLQQQLFVPVEVAHPLQSITVGDVGLTEEQLAAAEPLLAVPIGLALAGGPVARGTRRISLLPREVSLAREQRRQAILVGSAVAAFAVLLVLLWVLRGGAVQREIDRAEVAEARVAALQGEVAQLQDVTNLDAQIQQKTAAVQSFLASDVAWVRVIQETATVMPGDVWLTGFNGSKGATPGVLGQITFSVKGFDHTSTARWILRMSTMPSLTNLWVPSSTKGGGQVTFSSTASLAPPAISNRFATRYQLGQP